MELLATAAGDTTDDPAAARGPVRGVAGGPSPTGGAARPVAPDTTAEWAAAVAAGQGAVDRLSATDLGRVPHETLAETVVALRRLADRIDAEWMRWVREFDRRGAAAEEGALSTAAWLRERCHLQHGTAADRVRVARALERLPVTGAAFAAGDLSYAHARVLAGAPTPSTRAQYAEIEPVLVQAASQRTPREVQGLVDHWRAHAQADGGADVANERYARRRLHVSHGLDGMVTVGGLLDPEGGEIVATALRALVVRDRPADVATPAQRSADALVELCRRALDAGLPGGAERPHVSVVVSGEVLLSGAPGRCEAEHVGRLAPETARRLACDASVRRVIVDAVGEPLDVGRRTRTVPAGLRRAVVVRDGGCRYPGCDRPPGWCDAHHLRHWADGGTTSLENLVLLCSRHHRLVHEGGIALRPEDLAPARGSPGTPGPAP